MADEPVPPTDSALDYLRTVLGGAARSMPLPAPSSMSAPSPMPAAPRMARPLMRRMEVAEPPPRYLAGGTGIAGIAGIAAEGPPPAAPPTARTLPMGTDRPRPRCRTPHPSSAHAGPADKRVDRLVTIARELLEEDRP